MNALRFQRLHVPGQRLQFVERVRLVEREDTGLRAPQTAQMRSAAQVLAQFVRHRAHIAAGADRSW